MNAIWIIADTVRTDAVETDNVISRNPDVAAELHRLLVKFMAETNVPRRLVEPRLELKI